MSDTGDYAEYSFFTKEHVVSALKVAITSLNQYRESWLRAVDHGKELYLELNEANDKLEKETAQLDAAWVVVDKNIECQNILLADLKKATKDQGILNEHGKQIIVCIVKSASVTRISVVCTLKEFADDNQEDTDTPYVVRQIMDMAIGESCEPYIGTGKDFVITRLS